MPRVKRSVHARKKRRKVLEQAKGYWGLKHSTYRQAKEQVEHSLAYAYRDRKNRKREFRRLWILRINAAARAERALVQPVHRGLPQGRDRARPEGLGRLGRFRPGSLHGDRRAGEVARSRAERLRRTVFLDQAAATGARSPLYAELCRRFADDPLVDPLVGPRACLGRAASLARRAPWARPDAAGPPGTTSTLRSRSTRVFSLRRWRSGLCRRTRLAAAGFCCRASSSSLGGAGMRRSISSSSARARGLNLMWDRYRYVYGAGEWGQRGRRTRVGRRGAAPVPAGLLRERPRIWAPRRHRRLSRRRHDRRGRVAAEVLCLGRPARARLDLLERAIATLREEPPELVARRHRGRAAGRSG